jgi:hypothetical protein
MSRTSFPEAASFRAVAQARDVFPTPPFPVKNRYMGFDFSITAGKNKEQFS